MKEYNEKLSSTINSAIEDLHEENQWKKKLIQTAKRIIIDKQIIPVLEI